MYVLARRSASRSFNEVGRGGQSGPSKLRLEPITLFDRKCLSGLIDVDNERVSCPEYSELAMIASHESTRASANLEPVVWSLSREPETWSQEAEAPEAP